MAAIQPVVFEKSNIKKTAKKTFDSHKTSANVSRKA